MASSRIYVSGLPGNITESDFKKHFSSFGPITDTKLIPRRKIGFVGYGTPDEAFKAVKYFNKTFIRMSRLHVELATPITEGNSVKARGSRTSGANNEISLERSTEKKKDSEEADQNQTESYGYSKISETKKRKRSSEAHGLEAVDTADKSLGTSTSALAEQQSDDEYETLPKKLKSTEVAPRISKVTNPEAHEPANRASPDRHKPDQTPVDASASDQAAITDADWARSRTSRLLGLLDDDEGGYVGRDAAEESKSISSEPVQDTAEKHETLDPVISIPTPPSEDAADNLAEPPVNTDIEKARSTMRLFIRNLPYAVTAEDLETAFESYGDLEEVHVVPHKENKSSKGTAFIQFSSADAAVAAFRENDGKTFQGRLMHILPADVKRETRLNDFELSQLPHKKQQLILKRREAASKRFNWNSLYMNPDAVVSSVAGRLGLAKSDVLDPTSSDAAVKQAHAETHIIQETKAYFEQHGIDLNAFKRKRPGDTAILVKNIPYGSEAELRQRFEKHGELKRFLMPPSGTIAIIEFSNAAHCEAAFGASNHRKFGNSVLHLEKAPKGLFDSTAATQPDKNASGDVIKTSATDLKDTEFAITDFARKATVHVGNLNFKTTKQGLTEAFKPLTGFLLAIVKTRTDPKRPEAVLSQGYGFLEFRTPMEAQAAIQAMNGYSLDGHKIELKASHKYTDAADERRKLDAEKKVAGKGTKIAIKNLPFEARKQDVRSLFGAYGQLRSVRVPRKMDNSLRGFGFAEFTTPKEAENAMHALRDTHLLGRRLVLSFADDEPQDAEAEIQKMQERVGAQVNKVALQKLTSGGRQKFTTQADDE